MEGKIKGKMGTGRERKRRWERKGRRDGRGNERKGKGKEEKMRGKEEEMGEERNRKRRW